MSKNMKVLISGVVIVVIAVLGFLGYNHYQQEQLQKHAREALELSIKDINKEFKDSPELDTLNEYSDKNIDAKVYLNPDVDDKNIYIVKASYPIVNGSKSSLNLVGEITDKSKVIFEKQTTFDSIDTKNNKLSHIDTRTDEPNPKTGKLIYQINNYKIDRKDN